MVNKHYLILLQSSSYTSKQWRRFFIWIFLNSLDTPKHGNTKKLSIKRFLIFTCKLVISKKLVRNQNLKWNVVFMVFRGVVRNLSRRGLTFFFIPGGGGLSNRWGLKKNLKSIDIGGPGGCGWSPIPPPLPWLRL